MNTSMEKIIMLIVINSIGIVQLFPQAWKLRARTNQKMMMIELLVILILFLKGGYSDTLVIDDFITFTSLSV